MEFTNLRINKIGDGGAKSLAEALKKNTTLEYLNLWHNEIGAEGAKAIAEVLKESEGAGLSMLIFFDGLYSDN